MSNDVILDETNLIVMRILTTLEGVAYDFRMYASSSLSSHSYR